MFANFQSAYLLTTSAFQLFYGKAYTFFSIKYTFILAIGIFELGSLVCALAPSSTALIIGRAVSGLGGSGIFAGALVIIAHSVPLHRRPIFFGSMGGMFGIASVCGPLLGGAFTDKLTWRWCFYVNLPFGAVTVLAVLLFFKPPSRPAIAGLSFLDRVKKIDWLGLLCFIPSIVSLLLALQWGGSTYAWSDGRIIGLFVVFGVMGIAFVLVEYWKKDDATVPPRVIMQRSVAAGAWYAFCNGAGFFVVVYYVPLWHQVIRGVSAVESGICLLPMMVGLVVMVIMSGGLVTLIGYCTSRPRRFPVLFRPNGLPSIANTSFADVPFMLLSSIIAPIGEGLLSTWTVDTTFSQWFGFQALTGIGIGLGMQQPVVAVQTVLPIEDLPVGSAIVVFMQTLGGAVLVSAAQTTFQNRLLQDLQEALPGGSFDPAGLLRTGATEISAKVPPELLPTVLVAFNDALTHVFTVSICMSALTMVGSLAMEWRSVKKKGAKKTDVKNTMPTTPFSTKSS